MQGTPIGMSMFWSMKISCVYVYVYCVYGSKGPQNSLNMFFTRLFCDVVSMALILDDSTEHMYIVYPVRSYKDMHKSNNTSNNSDH